MGVNAASVGCKKSISVVYMSFLQPDFLVLADHEYNYKFPCMCYV